MDMSLHIYSVYTHMHWKRENCLFCQSWERRLQDTLLSERDNSVRKRERDPITAEVHDFFSPTSFTNFFLLKPQDLREAEVQLHNFMTSPNPTVGFKTHLRDENLWGWSPFFPLLSQRDQTPFREQQRAKPSLKVPSASVRQQHSVEDAFWAVQATTSLLKCQSKGVCNFNLRAKRKSNISSSFGFHCPW